MHFCINVSVGLFCLPAPFSSVFPSILDLPLYTNSQEYYGYIWLLLTYNTQKEDRETIKEKEKKKPTASHPSMKGQRPQECWIGVTWNHRRHPLPRTVLSASVRITGYRRCGCRWGRQESILYAGAGRTHDSIIGEATFRSQSASE